MSVRLRLLGYLNEYNDMADAVANFQRANGIPVTGTADPTTMDKLMSDGAVSYKEYLAYYTGGIEFDGELKLGMNGKNVKKLQQYLQNLGYFTSEPDGVYDMETACAVAVFQTVNCLEVTSKANMNTVACLTSPSAISASSYTGNTNLKYGDDGARVKRLQKLLSEAGYFEGEVTGVFGRKTQSAVIAFQQSNGLENTGVWTIEMTVLMLNGESVDKTTSEMTNASVTLYCGSNHYLVKVVETGLYNLGFFAGSPDEVFDEKTEKALKLFQEANGLEITGIADETVRSKLKEENCVSLSDFAIACAQVPVSEGNENYAVYTLTLRLCELGYPVQPGRVFSEDVTKAVMVFQKAEGLEVTGDADEVTRSMINSAAAKKYTEAYEIYARLESIDSRTRVFNEFMSTVNSLVGAPYEAGKTGPDSFGVGGFTYYCYSLIGVGLAPKAGMQYENAYAAISFSADVMSVSPGDLVFFKNADSVITGICADDGVVIYASPDEGRVVSVEIETMLEKYEFAGTAVYIDAGSDF